ncbi:MAG: putative metal-binding motif-containing protein, partial [Nitrospirae bacterium]|nr:putative metal-binding motif-containing protein [Nitrospirota bacterium]
MFKENLIREKVVFYLFLLFFEIFFPRYFAGAEVLPTISYDGICSIGLSNDKLVVTGSYQAECVPSNTGRNDAFMMRMYCNEEDYCTDWDTSSYHYTFYDTTSLYFNHSDCSILDYCPAWATKIRIKVNWFPGKWQNPYYCAVTSIYTEYAEVPYDCYHLYCEDNDHDSDGYFEYSGTCWKGDDCNDNDPAISPGAQEICDGID